MVFIKRISKGSAIVSLSSARNEPVSITFPTMVVSSINDFKYLGVKTNLNDEDNVRVYRFIEGVENSMEQFFNKRKTYCKSVLTNDSIKVKIPFKGHNFQVDTPHLITELEVGRVIEDVVIELKNIYVLDKGYYDIVGCIWILKSFN